MPFIRKLNAYMFVLLTACASQNVPSTATLPPPRVAVETFTPTLTPVFTHTPQYTPTPADPIFPYTIEGLRAHQYASGKITIIETLGENDQYTTYYIEYPSDGLRITGVMRIPVGDGPFPVILMNHGYFNRGDYYSGDGTDRAAEFLSKRGFITLSSDYRSWGDSDIGHSFFYSGLAIDVLNLLKAVPSIPQADVNRVGMWGHSMGGGATLKALTILTERVATREKIPQIKAAVLYSTVSADFVDLIDRWGMGCFGDIAAGEKLIGCNSSDIIPATLPRELQDAYRLTANDTEALKEVSPFYYLADITIPIQIHYGTNDGKFLSGTPPEWSQKLYKGFEEAGNGNAQLFAYEGESHSFKSDAWFAFMERASQLYEKNLK